MSTHVSTIVWFTGSKYLPSGEINPGSGRPFPMIDLAPSARLQGYIGDYVPYLRKLAEVAATLADELEAAKAMAADAPVCAHCALPAGHTGDHAPAVRNG